MVLVKARELETGTELETGLIPKTALVPGMATARETTLAPEAVPDRVTEREPALERAKETATEKGKGMEQAPATGELHPSNRLRK